MNGFLYMISDVIIMNLLLRLIGLVLLFTASFITTDVTTIFISGLLGVIIIE